MASRRWLTLVALLTVGVTAYAAPTKRALLIGINEYASGDIVDLRGARNDVSLIRSILIERLGFRESDVTVILDDAATRASVLAAIEDAVAATQPDDFLYFHYSGHGSRVPDGNGDEADGFDETIIPHDGRTGDVPDILDDEIDTLLAALDGEGLIVFDSCHSGTVTRSISDIRPRFVPPDTRVHLYRTVRTRAVVKVPELKHILMTSAADSEEALDGPVGGSYYGFFSYALAQGMANLRPEDLTSQGLYRAARAGLATIQEDIPFRMPEPQLEGPAELLSRTLFVPPAQAVVTRSPDVALAALANVSSEMGLTIELARPFACGPVPKVRGIRTLNESDQGEQSNVRRVRGRNDLRTRENSLQVRITSATEAYVTLLYVDSTGGAALMFPDATAGYLPLGRVEPGAAVCLPDSLRPDNEAGFYWDFGPPAGADTVKVIATPDLATANRIRDLMRSDGTLEEKVGSLESMLSNATDWIAADTQVVVEPAHP